MGRQLTPKIGTINYHAGEINKAVLAVKTSFFELITAIKVARDQLGDEVFQSELASKLSMSQSTLTKYIKIAECEALMRNTKHLPPTLTTLYDLTLLRSQMVKAFGETTAEHKFATVVSKLSPTTEANEIAPLITKAKEAVSKKLKRKREQQILDLDSASSKHTTKETKITPWGRVLNSKVVYKTVFMNPSDKTLGWIGDTGVFLHEIAERYPVADLRAPSQTETVQGFIYCSANLIHAGLKLLAASGFNYRDIFFPGSGLDGFELLQRQKILIRGERGAKERVSMQAAIEVGDEGAILIAESLGSEPRIYVFAEEALDGWTCSNPDEGT